MSLFLHYHHIQTYLNILVVFSNKIIFFFNIRDMITDSREDLTNSVAAAVKEHKEIIKNPIKKLSPMCRL